MVSLGRGCSQLGGAEGRKQESGVCTSRNPNLVEKLHVQDHYDESPLTVEGHMSDLVCLVHFPERWNDEKQVSPLFIDPETKSSIDPGCVKNSRVR